MKNEEMKKESNEKWKKIMNNEIVIICRNSNETIIMKAIIMK